MATFTTISLTVTILVAICSAAPNKNLNLQIPDECKGKGFCNIKPEGYDEMQDIIGGLLSRNFIAQSIGDRFGDDEITEELSPQNDWHNCPYRKTIEPKYLYSHSNESESDYIIQHELLKQPIEIVTCANDKIESTGSQECFQDLGLSSFSLKFTCVSSTAKRSLLVFDYKLKEIRQKSYDVPCCCSCEINSTV